MYAISYNKETCLEYRIIPVRRPSVPAPEENITETQIPGMDGALYERPGTYAPLVIPVEFNFMAPPDQWGSTYRKAKRWLSGSGELVLGDDQEFFYKVYFCRITDTERTSRRIGTFTAEFTCHPYQYAVAGQKEMSIADAQYNPYDICHPIYKITGTGACTLTVNGKAMQATVNQDLTINTDRMISYNSQGASQNTLVTGDYEDLYLQPGNNTISITSGFTVQIIPAWRCL